MFPNVSAAQLPLEPTLVRSVSKKPLCWAEVSLPSEHPSSQGSGLATGNDTLSSPPLPLPQLGSSSASFLASPPRQRSLCKSTFLTFQNLDCCEMLFNFQNCYHCNEIWGRESSVPDDLAVTTDLENPPDPQMNAPCLETPACALAVPS